MRRADFGPAILWCVSFAIVLACGPKDPCENCPTIEDMVVVATASVAAHVATYHDTLNPIPPDTLPPPPTGDTGLVGGVELSGAWDGWMGRHGMGSKFGSGDGYQWMGNNTNAGVKMPGKGNPGWLCGVVEFDWYYEPEDPDNPQDTEGLVGQGGGQHLIGLFSQSASRTGPYDPDLDHSLGPDDPLEGSCRLDWDVKPGGRINLVLFQSGPREEKVVGRLDGFGSVATWHHCRVEWQQTEDQIMFVVNGEVLMATVFPGRNPIGNLLFVGNMDTNRGDRCVNAPREPCGMTTRVRYRNIRWERGC